MSEPYLEIQNLHRFSLSGVNLSVHQGEFFGLLGPSGSGKTTILRCIAGLEMPDKGQIVLSGRKLNDKRVFVLPERRNLGLVFQSFALFPHLTVEQNIAFGLSKKHKADVQEIVHGLLKIFRISELAQRYPDQISGGQQQRVAIARALAPSPALLLLDEPFSNLDAAVRSDLRVELKELFNRLGITVFLISHDQHDISSTCHRMATLKNGVIHEITQHDKAMAIA